MPLVLRILKRLLRVIVILWVLVTASFFLIRFAPGDPLQMEREISPEARTALEAKYDLDKPHYVAYGRYLARIMRGDFGPSLKQANRSVNDIIARGLPVSALLGGTAMILALALGLGAGLASALRTDTVLDYSAMTIAVLGISLPTFVIGPLLQILFAMQWDWLPLAGYRGPMQPAYLVLPAVTLALPFAARIARLFRAGMLDVLQQDFVTVARAKGLPERTVVLRHALRGGLLPVASYLGPATAMILTGSLVVEQIFQIPGIGREFVEGALGRDHMIVMGIVVMYGALIVVFNLLVDLAYGLLDPRVRTAKA